MAQQRPRQTESTHLHQRLCSTLQQCRAADARTQQRGQCEARHDTHGWEPEIRKPLKWRYVATPASCCVVVTRHVQRDCDCVQHATLADDAVQWLSDVHYQPLVRVCGRCAAGTLYRAGRCATQHYAVHHSRCALLTTTHGLPSCAGQVCEGVGTDRCVAVGSRRQGAVAVALAA
jgi:hypothetical protein